MRQRLSPDLNIELTEPGEARRRPGEDHRRIDSADSHLKIQGDAVYLLNEGELAK